MFLSAAPGGQPPKVSVQVRAASASVSSPSIKKITPSNGTAGVPVNSYVGATLVLPNGGLDPTTINTADVYLYQTSNNASVQAVVNTSGAGDTLILQPLNLLEPNTQYTFVATSGVKDTSGAGLVPFTMSFTTGTTGAPTNTSVAFQKVALPTSSGYDFTCDRVGPDHMLYASTEEGQILRFAINPDGTLGAPQVITSLQTYERGNRLISGFAFDPSFIKDPSAPKLWVCNSYYAFVGSPDFTGKITIMSGADLQSVQDAVINLPRSYRDHLNEVPTFGPDGALYFCQGSSSSFGAPDSVWGNRSEHLLTAAILRLDTTRLPANLPLDVMTPDAGGSYNPFAAGAPLTIYATGVRNSFSLLWTKDGTLYAPSNGSSAGGNAPAFSSSDPNQVNGPRIDTGQPYAGPDVPAINNVSTNEEDYLFKIEKGGYYGHPNPTRGEFVLDGGNPGGAYNRTDAYPDYPAGTAPDPNYRGYVYDLGTFPSPDGIVEYSGNEFGGKLDGKLLVSNYSAGGNIVALTRGANGSITSLDSGIAGFSGFDNALTLTEDNSTGNIYIVELGARHITLLKPTSPPTAPLTTPQTHYMINVGGMTPYTDKNGNVWSPDEGYTGGIATDDPYTVPGTPDGEIFYDRRTGSSFNYSLPVVDGTYNVQLFFTDPVYNAAGQRVMDISAQGQTVLGSYDIIGGGGGKAPIASTFPVTVTNGIINLGFTGIVRDATLSAIEVTPQGSAPTPTPTPTPNPTPVPTPTPIPTPLPTGTLGALVSGGIPTTVVSGVKSRASASVLVFAPALSAVIGRVTVTLFVSPFQSLVGATQVGAPIAPKLKVKAGHARRLKLRIDAFPSVPAGVYYLIAAVKAPDGSVTAVVGPSLTIAPPFVKTTVSTVRPVPVGAAPGNHAGLLLTVTNAGNITASGSAPLTILVAGAGGAEQSIASIPLKVKLKPGASKAYHVRFKIPAGLLPGAYSITASLNVNALGDASVSDGIAVAEQTLLVS